MNHLSRISEELFYGPRRNSVCPPTRSVLYWFIHHAAEKNPDVPELVRGKSGRATGNLVALLT